MQALPEYTSYAVDGHWSCPHLSYTVPPFRSSLILIIISFHALLSWSSFRTSQFCYVDPGDPTDPLLPFSPFTLSDPIESNVPVKFVVHIASQCIIVMNHR